MFSKETMTKESFVTRKLVCYSRKNTSTINDYYSRLLE